MIMKQELWTAYEAAAATGGMLCAKGSPKDAENETWPEEDWSAKGLSIDTRTLRPGDIFVALKESRDGHDFVRSAFEKGAAAALVSRPPDNIPKNKPLLMVPDTLGGLRGLAAAARDRCFGQLIAVTGSAGKTSTKEMLCAALQGSGKVHAAAKSFNNHFGVPLTLAALPGNADFGIFEIGMNHKGEITPLTKLVQPHIAIVTTVAAAHLEFFDSIADIARAKAEIFSGLRTGGVAVLPRDNEHYDLLEAEASDHGARIISFGRHEKADYQLLDYQPGAISAEITADLAGERVSFSLKLTGEHQAMNALAVLAVVDAGKGDREKAITALEKFTAVEGRGARYGLTLNGKSVTLIDESYNANPASMSAALSSLEGLKGRRIAVLGDMLELGEDAQGLHLSLKPLLEAAKIDLIFCAGPMMRELFESLPQDMQGAWAEAAIDLQEDILANVETGDIIIAKGSNASKTSALVTMLRAHENTQEKTKG
jgi:UDP-N-acetylmuramoyl-tripeptide--D-alanyl-D-alanine ligase